MKLKEYRQKREFDHTLEPKGVIKKGGIKHFKFVVQKHQASHLHYDFRIELNGVLKSWAIPKGPSMYPSDKRLAIMVEDHPIEYGNFEGVIPQGNYGAGTVKIWDHGTYYPVENPNHKGIEQILQKGLGKGHLSFILEGKKLKGEFALIKLNNNNKNAWLLIKKEDQFSKKKTDKLLTH